MGYLSVYIQRFHPHAVQRSKVHEPRCHQIELAEVAERWQYFYNDCIHPSGALRVSAPCSNRQNMYPKQIVTILLLPASADSGHLAHAELLTTVLRTALHNVAAAGGPAAYLGSSNDALLELEIPPPMIAGNAERPTTLCAIQVNACQCCGLSAWPFSGGSKFCRQVKLPFVLQEAFKSIAPAMDGFEWRPERPDKPTFVVRGAGGLSKYVDRPSLPCQHSWNPPFVVLHHAGAEVGLPCRHPWRLD